MPRQDVFKQRQGHFSAPLGGGYDWVGQCRLRNIPGSVPRQVVDIDQQPHEFRHGQRRMRIVQLDSDFAREIVEILMMPQIIHHNILQGTGDQEVLLHRRNSRPASTESEG